MLITNAAYPQWARSPYSAENQAEFASWRALIPPGTEVLWYEYPLAAWTLLQRPDFASRQQGASALFSREAAMVLRDRQLALMSFGASLESAAVAPKTTKESQPAVALSTMCSASGARFVVTRDAPESRPLAIAAVSLPPELRDWKLFACASPTQTSPHP